MPPSRRNLLIGLLAALLLAGAGLAAWAWRPEVPAVAAALQDVERAGLDDAVLEIGDLPSGAERIDPVLNEPPAVASTAASAPLPELVVPLGQVIDELRRRTSEGEPQAACRLALSLAGCARVDQHRRIASQSDEALVERLAQSRGRSRRRQENQVDFFLRRQENAQRWVDYCDGMPALQRNEVIGALRIATELRDPTSIQHYLHFMVQGAGPYLLAYPAEAPLHRDTIRRTVLRMLRDGDHALLPWIGVMASPDLSPLFGDLLPEAFRDPQIGRLAYRIAASEARDAPMRHPRGHTPSADAMARAEQAYREYFGQGENRAAELQRMRQVQQQGNLDEDDFDRLEGCTSE